MGARIEPYDVAQVNQTAQQLRNQASGYAFSYIKNGVYRTRLGQEIKNWTDRLVEQFNNQTLSKQEVLKQFERERQNLLEQHQLLGIYGVDTITDAMARLYSHSDYGSARSLISVAGAMPNNDPLKELSITQPRWENTPNGQNFKLFRYVAQEQIELRLKGLGNSKLSLEERGRIRQDIINRKIIASSKPVMTPVKEEPKPQLSIKERWEKQRLENWNRAYGVDSALDQRQQLENNVVDKKQFGESLNSKVENEAQELIKAGKTEGVAISCAGIPELNIVSESFQNIPFSMKNKKTFPGTERCGDNYGSIKITDQAAYMMGLEDLYEKSGNPLNPVMRQKIKAHVKQDAEFSLCDEKGAKGVPGLHAEVQAANAILNQVKAKPGFDVSKIQVSTYKLQNSFGQGQPFRACNHCSGILKDFEILTGR